MSSGLTPETYHYRALGPSFAQAGLSCGIQLAHLGGGAAVVGMGGLRLFTERGGYIPFGSPLVDAENFPPSAPFRSSDGGETCHRACHEETSPVPLKPAHCIDRKSE